MTNPRPYPSTLHPMLALAAGLAVAAAASQSPMRAAAQPPAAVPSDAPGSGSGEIASANSADTASGASTATDYAAVAAPEALNFQVFSDVNFGADDVDGTEPAFFVGGTDLFITANLSDSVRVLSEDVLEILEDGPVFDLERIYLEWDVLSKLTLRLGRTHLMLGHYMCAFHHAAFFQLATARPSLLGFEDEGGLLPAHQIGLEAFGSHTFGSALTLGYAFGVGNGRGQYADDVLSTFDRNAFKALTARLSFEPLALEGLDVGFSGYLDKIPSGFTDEAGTVLVPEDLRELILGVHIVYESYPFQLHAEGYWLRHTSEESKRNTRLRGAFAQAGYTVGDFTPYARWDWLERDADDGFFNASGGPVNAQQGRAGVQYALAVKAVLKLEYTRDFEERTNRGVLQAAFAF